MSNKIKASIIGASGYTGSELARILANHPNVDLAHITSESHADKKFSDLHPQFAGFLEVQLESATTLNVEGQDVLFLALPHGVSMDFVKKWADKEVKIVDLSGDFRLSSPEVYEHWYKKEHVFAKGFKQAVYGMPELHAAEIVKANLVANPGCYPTASILSLAPLFAKKVIEEGSIIIDAKSGTTGAGIKTSPVTHFSNVNENFKAYGIGSHRHTIEIEEQLGKLMKRHAQVQFTPHLLPVDRGILATSYTRVSGEMDQEKLINLYKNYYEGKPFVRVRSQAPSLKDVRGSNFCDIFPFWDKRTKRAIILSAIDNLVKGAAGQAVHCMNLMFDREETEGLTQIPMQP
jgi:N-acetyl-gamma-glutamyl-phosphate reductase